MSSPSDVLIVGASVGGLTVAQALRRKGYTGRIRLVGEEPHPPYDRPPLSKEILTGAWPASRAQLNLDGLDADLILGVRAVRLDLSAWQVHLDNGRRLPYGTLVIATGLSPRRLPTQQRLDGVHTFRTLDDALALGRDLRNAERIAVIGAGVLGCELAAAARALGRDVTLIDPASVPMAGQLGDQLGTLMASLHRRHDVKLRTGAGVATLTHVRGRVTGVALTDGSAVAADLAIVAIGSTPAIGWLAGSGLRLYDGIECDAYGRAGPGVYAVGDVARPLGSVRLENRANATEQAVTVAATILGDGRPYTPVAYFWTEQYDAKIQVYGTITAGSRLRLIEGQLDEERFVALAETGGTVTAAIGWNHPCGARSARQHLMKVPGKPVGQE
ncbi:FAD-dependent oxidoreductase [Nonomuraea sp. NPDC005983]|uniref:NAD(P)/FAD-dependent oxidoreductase n=1 Tax=Nonomuraea sp. NPDC005983 TaxID=3155595 RepID=UPI0033A2D501